MITFWEMIMEVCLSTMETFLLHVDLTTRRSCPPAPDVAEALLAFAEAHAALPRPDQAGKAIGAR